MVAGQGDGRVRGASKPLSLHDRLCYPLLECNDTSRIASFPACHFFEAKTFCSQNTNLSHRREKSNETSLAENIFYHYIVMAYLLETTSSWSLLSGFGCCSGYQTKFCLSLTLRHAFTLTVWSALPLLVTLALPFHFASSGLLAGVRQVREGL